MAKLTPSGFLFRWLGALVLVLGTYNPTPYNFYSWVTEPDTKEDYIALKFLIAVLMIVGYVIYFRATLESISYIGIFLAIAVFGGLVWFLAESSILDLTDYKTVVWVVLFVIATIMAIGISWSFIRRKISGQVDQT